MSGPKRIEPSRGLFDPNKETQLRWADHTSTDIRKRFALIAAELQAQKQEQPNVAQLRKRKP